MSAPNFIGIGVQKGGTSWLHKQLLNHPQIFVPKNRKEIHFFDVYYNKGLDWYQKWFVPAQNHIAIGEITPNYIYDPATPQRIKQHYPDMRFIVMLRHPVERAYSHYQMTFQSGEGQKYRDFDDFMTRHPHAFKRGLYGAQIAQWQTHFKPEQFLFLTSEEIFKTENGVTHAFEKIEAFLNIDAALFDMTLSQKRVGGARAKPKHAGLAAFAQKLRLFLRDNDLDFIASGLKKIGLTRQIFGQISGKGNISIPPLEDNIKSKWIKKYQEDIHLLETLLKECP